MVFAGQCGSLVYLHHVSGMWNRIGSARFFLLALAAFIDAYNNTGQVTHIVTTESAMLLQNPKYVGGIFVYRPYSLIALIGSCAAWNTRDISHLFHL